MRRTVNVKRLLGANTQRRFDPRAKAQRLKEEKTFIETKEEKFIPETKETLSLRQLAEVINSYSEDQLLGILKNDERVGAKRLATEEIKRREG